MTKALDLFPLDRPRPSQALVIQEIEKAFSNNARFVILEGPVGSGKSAIAITIARLYGESHMITPRKSLQNQYFSDFSDHIVMMKGRSSYPCTETATRPKYKEVIELIQRGGSPLIKHGDTHCGNAPCVDDPKVFRSCTTTRDCPYHVAISSAQNSEHIVHNLHSFIFQTAYGMKFGPRELMIIDEAHEIEAMVRGFIGKSITLPKILRAEDEPGDFKNIDQWCNYFKQDKFANLFTGVAPKARFPEEQTASEKEKYLYRIEMFRKLSDTYKEDFVVKRESDSIVKRTKFEFIPDNIGGAVNSVLFEYGKKILLMSGTIYSKEQFCKTLGIKPSEAYFIRTNSSFPIASRPIYMKPEYMVNTSHATWTANFPKMIENIRTIMDKFPDAKGLIHAPSYVTADQIAHALHDNRVISHGRDDFLVKLEKFYDTPGNRVFISPVCQQGVDFKDDRARFQIVLRVPYPNSGDAFISHKMKKDFSWYNYQALIVFGQQIGRINRSEQDFGVTVLMDDRFPKFIRSNNRALPKWLKDAIITK